jgi:hypothetical protein
VSLQRSLPGSREVHVYAEEDVTVWVNTRSGVYHYPGTRWYGNTKSEPKALFPCGRLSEQSLIAFYEPSEIAGLEGSVN